MERNYWRVCLLGVVGVFSSCEAFFPGRLDSGQRAGEVVSVDLKFTAGGVAPAAAGAAIAGVLAGLAVDVVAKELAEEATRYEAQFTGADAQNLGEGGYPTELTILRTMDLDPAGAESFKFTAKIQAVRMSGGGKGASALKLIPQSLQVRNSKAKVFSDGGLWNILPTVWFGKLFRTSGHHIGVQIDVVITGAWVDDEGRARKLDATFSIPEVQVDLDKQDGTYAFSKPPVLMAGAFPAESIFTVRATVTEKDPSNAKKYLEKLAASVADQKSTVVEFVQKQVSP